MSKKKFKVNPLFWWLLATWTIAAIWTVYEIWYENKIPHKL